MRRWRLLSLLLMVGPTLSACGGREVVPVEPLVAAAAIERTAPDRPLRVIFDWELLDGEARFSGSGVARIEPPYRVRLDLFGPRGESYLSAALVEDDLRVPPGADRVPLPPAAMIWAALGVVAPPVSAVLTGTRLDEAETELTYDLENSRLRYGLRDGELSGARWDGGGRRMQVVLTGRHDAGLPLSSYFRDHSGNVELMLDVQRVDEVDPYPPEIWMSNAD